MSTVFNLQRSLEICRDLLSAHDANVGSWWSTCAPRYRREKAALLAALCPETGRRTVPYVRTLTDAERGACWSLAITAGANDAAIVALHRAEADHERYSNDRSQKTLDRRRATFALMQRARPHLIELSRRIYGEEYAQGKIITDLLPSYCPDVKSGMTLSRALSAYLRSHPVPVFSADEASIIVDAIATAAQAKNKEGHIVLSVNPLDLLLTSESSAWTSCHSFEGCHQAGPQASLYDPHCAVAYYYEEERAYRTDLELPYKLARQMIYVDASNRAAAVQRLYGRELPEDGQRAMNREIARLLCRLDGRPDADPAWKRGEQSRDARISNRAGLIYLDATEVYLSLDGDRPEINLAKDVPCPACGDDMDEPSKLMCGSCCNLQTCDGCERTLEGDEYYSFGDSVYCERCYTRRFFSCDGCHDDFARDDMAHEDGSNCYCSDCANEHYPECSECDERTPSDNMDDGLCPDCYEECHPRCEECGQEYDTDDASSGDVPDTEGHCPACTEEQARRLRLFARLWRSPLARRLCVHDAIFNLAPHATTFLPLFHRWQHLTVSTHEFYLPRLIALVL